MAVTGIYFLTPKIFDIISRLKPSWRNELEITDALQMLLEEGNKIKKILNNHRKLKQAVVLLKIQKIQIIRNQIKKIKLYYIIIQ